MTSNQPRYMSKGQSVCEPSSELLVPQAGIVYNLIG